MNALIALRLQFSSPFHHSFCLFSVSLYNSCLSTSRLVTFPLPLALGPHPLLNDLFCSEFVLRRVHIPASSWFKQLEYSHQSQPSDGVVPSAVCRVPVLLDRSDPSLSAHRARHHSRTFYLCQLHCRSARFGRTSQ